MARRRRAHGETPKLTHHPLKQPLLVHISTPRFKSGVMADQVKFRLCVRAGCCAWTCAKPYQARVDTALTPGRSNR